LLIGNIYFPNYVRSENTKGFIILLDNKWKMNKLQYNKNYNNEVK